MLFRSAAVEYDPDLDSFFGQVVNLSSPLTFYGKTTEELRREFANSISEYLAVCKEQGITPEKPFSGRITVRTSPELHRDIARAAAAEGKSINAWITETLRRKAESERDGQYGATDYAAEDKQEYKAK